MLYPRPELGPPPTSRPPTPRAFHDLPPAAPSRAPVIRRGRQFARSFDHQFARACVCECASVRVCECASVRVYEYTSIRVYECTSIRVYECTSECTSVRVYGFFCHRMTVVTRIVLMTSRQCSNYKPTSGNQSSRQPSVAEVVHEMVGSHYQPHQASSHPIGRMRKRELPNKPRWCPIWAATLALPCAEKCWVPTSLWP